MELISKKYGEREMEKRVPADPTQDLPSRPSTRFILIPIMNDKILILFIFDSKTYFI